MPRVEASETEPLLGRPGDVTQQDRQIGANLWLGTAVLAQAGIWILAATIWAAVFKADLILFSVHPLLNSAGVLLLTQGILVLQPTHTDAQKRNGTLWHAGFNGAGTLLLLGGLVAILVNKIGHEHFKAAHNYFGVVLYVVLAVQAVVGFTQYWVPQLYGGVDAAKRVWKYHRVSGYAVLLLSLATVCSAVKTQANDGMLHIAMWKVAVASTLVVLGVLPRIKLHKLGWKTAAATAEE